MYVLLLSTSAELFSVKNNINFIIRSYLLNVNFYYIFCVHKFKYFVKICNADIHMFFGGFRI